MPLMYFLHKIRTFFIYRVLNVQDTPHRIALGVAIGIFVTFTPTVGFQMVITLALSALLKGNKLVGVPFVWLSNPATFLVIYGPSFWLGNYMLGGRYSFSDFTDALRRAMDYQGGFFDPDRIRAWWEAIMPIFFPLWAGSLVVAMLMGLITYISIRMAVIHYRRSRGLPLDGSPPDRRLPSTCQAGSKPERSASSDVQ